MNDECYRCNADCYADDSPEKNVDCRKDEAEGGECADSEVEYDALKKVISDPFVPSEIFIYDKPCHTYEEIDQYVCDDFFLLEGCF